MRTSLVLFAIVLALSTLLARVPDTAAARAEALYSAHDYLAAASAFQALTQRNLQQPRYWTRLGASYQRAGRLDDALSAYRQAISLTVAPAAMYHAATVLGDHARPAEAAASHDVQADQSGPC